MIALCCFTYQSVIPLSSVWARNSSVMVHILHWQHTSLCCSQTERECSGRVVIKYICHGFIVYDLYPVRTFLSLEGLQGSNLIKSFFITLEIIVWSSSLSGWMWRITLILVLIWNVLVPRATLLHCDALVFDALLDVGGEHIHWGFCFYIHSAMGPWFSLPGSSYLVWGSITEDLEKQW